jgi:hypothetical protein
LFAGKPEQQQSRAHHVKSTLAPLIDRIAEKVVAANLEIGHLHPLEKADIDVCCDDVAGLPNTLRHPDRHRTSARSDLEAPPARLHEIAELLRRRIVDLLEQLEPLILGLLAAACRKLVAGLDVAAGRRRWSTRSST